MDIKNNANTFLSDFISTKRTITHDDGTTEEVGLGFTFDADDNLAVGEGLIKEFGEEIDFMDYTDAGKREEYYLNIRSMKREDLYWVQSQDGNTMMLHWAGDPNMVVIPPIRTADLAKYYQAGFSSGAYEGH